MIEAVEVGRYAAGSPRELRYVMNQRERFALTGALILICALIGADLLNDSGQGVTPWHVMLEAAAGAASLLALFVLLRGAFNLRRRLHEEIASSSALRQEADRWRLEARRHVEGLAKAIDGQLTKWRLTAAEKEVAFLLLKGYGLKEIAHARNTSEKTTRAQSTSIYAKAGLNGRSELAAFFLEDLLVPPAPEMGTVPIS